MRVIRWALILAVCLPGVWAATFGTPVPLVGGAADIILDEAHNRLYLVNTTQSRVDVYSIAQRRFLNPIRTDGLPLAGAISRQGKYLYVTDYDRSALVVIDLDAMTVATRVNLPAKPEGVAVGADDRVLITTVGTGVGNTSYVLLIYDPWATQTVSLATVPVQPPPPVAPVLPPPSGRTALAVRSQLVATPDGSKIIGLNDISAAASVVFVYDVASAIVLRSRQVSGISTVLAVTPNGSAFIAGITLFDTETLTVLAEQNPANAQFPFSTGTGTAAQFRVYTNQGGSVVAPDGKVIYSAFNIAPAQNPPARANISTLLLNEPDNLLVNLALQLPENLVGKMVISSDGGNIYAISESGFTILPISTLAQSPIAVPDSTVVLLANDQCGSPGLSRTLPVKVQNVGRGRMTATAQFYPTATTGGTQPAPQAQTAPQVRTTQLADGTQLDFTFNSAAGRSPGTVPPHDFLIQSNEAVNIAPVVRVFQNNRDNDARGDLIPVPVGYSTSEGLMDVAGDLNRRRLYLANSALNRVEVFDLRTRQLLEPIKVGQLPRYLALAPDGNTLYVANTGGESISIVDLDARQVVGRIKFPPIPLNGSVPLVTPAAIAASQAGLEIVMSDGRLWTVVNNEALPRTPSAIMARDAAGRQVPFTAPWTMTSTPGGEYIFLLTGNGFVYLYSATADSWIQTRQIFTGRPSGYNGPVAAGPGGQYFLANGTVMNQSLTPTGNAGTTPTNVARPVAAVAQAGTSTFARFVQPVRTSATVLPTETPTVELVDASRGTLLRTSQALEGPLLVTVGAAAGAVNLPGRTMTVDAAGTNAYVITTSGLSIVPLDPVSVTDRPAVNPRGTVNLADYTQPVAPGSLISIFGSNLGSTAVASAMPLPRILDGACVTLSDQPIPLLMTSTGQINAQIPPEAAVGRYNLVVRSIAKKASSQAQQITLTKVAPAVFVDGATRQTAIFHSDGRWVTQEDPAHRDEPLLLYAVGLGATSGGKATSGTASPSNPLAVVNGVEVFFGDPRYKEAGIIVEWAGLAPGFVGLYQINLRVPGAHISGQDLLITVRVSDVDSSVRGPVVPTVAVE